VGPFAMVVVVSCVLAYAIPERSYHRREVESRKCQHDQNVYVLSDLKRGM